MQTYIYLLFFDALGGGGSNGIPPPKELDVGAVAVEDPRRLLPSLDFLPGMDMENVCPSFKDQSFLGAVETSVLSFSLVGVGGFKLAK